MQMNNNLYLLCSFKYKTKIFHRYNAIISFTSDVFRHIFSITAISMDVILVCIVNRSLNAIKTKRIR